MGNTIFDKYTYLHFASGIISYFWNISLINWLIIHTAFEYIENTKQGVYFIDKYLTFWPGGKVKADSFINNIGDTIGAIIGWISAHYVSTLSFSQSL